MQGRELYGWRVRGVVILVLFSAARSLSRYDKLETATTVVFFCVALSGSQKTGSTGDVFCTGSALCPRVFSAEKNCVVAGGGGGGGGEVVVMVFVTVVGRGSDRWQ